MAPSGLSKRRWPGWLLLGLTLTALGACATGRDAELRRLRAQALYDRAFNELSQGQTSVGLASLEEAVNLDPRQPLYQNTLGIVRLSLKNFPQAMDAFKKALEIKPDYAEAQHNLGVTLAEMGRWEEAINAYRKALTIPTNVNPESVYTNMGLAYYNLGRLAEAEGALRQALRLEPTLAAAHYNLGLVLLKAGRPEEARASFSAVVEALPDSEFARAAREHLKALGERK